MYSFFQSLFFFFANVSEHLLGVFLTEGGGGGRGGPYCYAQGTQLGDCIGVPNGSDRSR